MVIKRITYSGAFHRFVELLLQLHREMTTGDPDGKKADLIRDEMDRPWHEMSESEQLLARGLSADLYTIGATREVASDTIPPQAHDLKHAVDNLDWPRVLELIRRDETSLDPVAVAYSRGMAWMQLGFPAVAGEFLRDLARLEKPKPSQEVWKVFANATLPPYGQPTGLVTNF